MCEHKKYVAKKKKYVASDISSIVSRKIASFVLKNPNSFAIEMQ